MKRTSFKFSAQKLWCAVIVSASILTGSHVYANSSINGEDKKVSKAVTVQMTGSTDSMVT